MKKIIALLLCLSALFCLTSCDAIIDRFKTVYFYYDFEEISQNVEKAEIIQLPHSDIFLDEIDNLEESEIEILATFNYDRTMELLQDFSQIQYFDSLFLYNGPPRFGEKCIRVWYLDGTFDIYSSQITTVRWGCTHRVDFYGLINRYLEQ